MLTSPARLPGVPRTSTRTPGRLGHGHSLPGPWPRRPVPCPTGASSTRPRPSPPGRQLDHAASLLLGASPDRAPSLRLFGGCLGRGIDHLAEEREAVDADM